jgi:hypothetical protein
MAELLIRSVSPAVMVPLAAQAFEDVMLNRRFPMMRISMISAIVQDAATQALHDRPERLPADQALSTAANKVTAAFRVVLREFGTLQGTVEAVVRVATADLAEVIEEAAVFVSKARDMAAETSTQDPPGLDPRRYVRTGDTDETAADLAAALAAEDETRLAALRMLVNGRHHDDPLDRPDGSPDPPAPPPAA